MSYRHFIPSTPFKSFGPSWSRFEKEIKNFRNRIKKILKDIPEGKEYEDYKPSLQGRIMRAFADTRAQMLALEDFCGLIPYWVISSPDAGQYTSQICVKIFDELSNLFTEIGGEDDYDDYDEDEDLVDYD